MLGFGVRAVGLEPTCLVSYGFGDRCVCQFRHARTMEYQAGSILKCSPLLFAGIASGGPLILILMPLRINQLQKTRKAS